MSRYHRQILLPAIGQAGQHKLAEAGVLLIGCGALGCTIAEQLVRGGVGRVRIADRDLVEVTNLQRQVLFDESDAKENLPKAVAAARRLRAINSEVRIEPLVTDVHAENIESVLDASTRLILDGTDNAQTRYLINDVSIKLSIPWIYGACVGMEGRVMAIDPANTPCLRCVFRDPPDAGELPTCDTAGVLGPAAAVVGALQATAAMKYLIEGTCDAALLKIDLWQGRFRRVDLTDTKRADCPACGRKQLEFLSRSVTDSISLCGSNAVQVRPPRTIEKLDLTDIAAKLRAVGRVQQSGYLVRCDLNESPGLRLSIFADGRMIVHGTADFAKGRSLYARLIGS